jgi:hypothetical protein
MGLWGRKEVDREVPACMERDTGVGESFDDLARSIAGGTMPRRRAMRLLGGALVGTAVASIPGVALAAPNPKRCGSLGLCPGDLICVQRGRNPRCGCPSGSTQFGTTCCPDAQVCGSGADATCGCPPGQACVSGTCQEVCPTVSCCCVCGFQDPTTGQITFVCDSTTTATTEAQCREVCENATPPPGTVFITVGHACEPGSSGIQRLCEPVTGPNFGGTVCVVDECTPPPT